MRSLWRAVALGVVCLLGLVTVSRAQGNYNYGEVIRLSNLFFEAQRSGRLPADNRIPWRGDSMLNDRDGNIDLTGGYFDAGDHVKFGLPLAFSLTLIGWSLLDYKYGYDRAGQFEDSLKTLNWGLDYLIRAHPEPNVLYGQIGNGVIDHSVWVRPEDWPSTNLQRPIYKLTTQAPGSDLAADTASAFAVSSMIYRNINATFADECLRHARELYTFANSYRGRYTDSIPDALEWYNPPSDYGDELAFAAAWLYRATSQLEYFIDFYAFYSEFNLGYRPHSFGWDDKRAGLQVLMAKITGEQVYMNAAKQFCDDALYVMPRTPRGLVYLLNWGPLRWAANVAFICLQAADLNISPNLYRDFARQQIGYILGDTGRSYVCGYGVNPPQRPHHRGSACPVNGPCGYGTINDPAPNPNILYGAMVGGPDSNDQFIDSRTEYEKTEVGIDYNAGLQAALAGLNNL